MGFELDTSTAYGAKVAKQVVERKLGWLTTVSSDGTPQPNPVWFLWDDGRFILFSEPGQAKLKNIARSGRVSFNLEATEDEEQITIFTGGATEIDRGTIRQALLDEYAAKYVQGMINIKLTRAEYEAKYLSVIEFKPEKVRGW